MFIYRKSHILMLCSIVQSDKFKTRNHAFLLSTRFLRIFAWLFEQQEIFVHSFTSILLSFQLQKKFFYWSTSSADSSQDCELRAIYGAALRHIEVVVRSMEVILNNSFCFFSQHIYQHFLKKFSIQPFIMWEFSFLLVSLILNHPVWLKGTYGLQIYFIYLKWMLVNKRRIDLQAIKGVFYIP